MTRTERLAPALVLAGFLVPAFPARADEVILVSGGRIEGTVEIEGDLVRIAIPGGSLEIPRSEVFEIERKEAPADRFETYFSQIPSADAQSLYELGVWARDEGLFEASRRAFESAIAAVPDHEKARRELGYFRHEGRWVTEDELMASRGYVRVAGKWRAPEEVLAEERARWEAEAASAREEGRLREEELLARIRFLEGEVARLAREVSRPPLVIRRIVRIPYPLAPGSEPPCPSQP